MSLKSGAFAALALILFALPAMAQAPARYTFFGGALLGTPNGFSAGAGLTFNINRNVSFDPTAAVGRSGHTGLFTLGGVGLAQWGSSTHGSGIAGVGARFPIGHHAWIVPEVRGATHGLARFTI